MRKQMEGKEKYQAPVTTKRVVMMEGSACVVTSNDSASMKLGGEQPALEVEDYESFTNEVIFE